MVQLFIFPGLEEREWISPYLLILLTFQTKTIVLRLRPQVWKYSEL